MLAAVRWILTFLYIYIHCFCCRFPLRITQRKSEALQTRESLLGYAVLSSARAAMQLRKTDGCRTDKSSGPDHFYLNRDVFHTPRVRFPFTTTQCTRPCCSAASFFKAHSRCWNRSRRTISCLLTSSLCQFPLRVAADASANVIIFKTGFDASRSVQAVAKKKKKSCLRVNALGLVLCPVRVCVLTLFHYLYTLRRALRRSAHELRYSP